MALKLPEPVANPAYTPAIALHPRAFTVRETARLLSLSEPTVWKMLKLGELRAVKLLGRRLVPSSEIDRILTVESVLEPIAA